MYSLPQEIQKCIYEFDPTYKEKFDIVLQNIKPKFMDVIEYYIDNYCNFNFEIQAIDIIENDVFIFNNILGITFAKIYTEEQSELLWKNKLRNHLYYINYNKISKYLNENISEEFYNEIQRVALTLEETSEIIIHNIDINSFIKNNMIDIMSCINNAVSLEDIKEYYYLNNNECEIITFQKNKYVILNKLPETIRVFTT